MADSNVLFIEKNGFKAGPLLGEGSYGSVYEVEKDGVEYAMKIIDNSFKGGIKSLRELDIMSRLKHDNITPSRGIFSQITQRETKKHSDVGILMDKAYGSLYGAIKKGLSEREALRILCDITMGLEFLHKNMYLHLDIKSTNILVFEESKRVPPPSVSVPVGGPKKLLPLPVKKGLRGDLRGKLADFGLALLEEEVDGKKFKTFPKAMITVDHRSPYILEGGRIYTEKDDIWSLGIVFLFTLSEGDSIFRGFKKEDYTPENVLKGFKEKFSAGVIDETLDKMLKYSTISSGVRKSAHLLIKRMLSFDPAIRPTAKEILSSSLFALYDKNAMSVVLTPSIPEVSCNPYYYEGIDSIVRMCINLPVTVETFFLSVDLFVRLFSFFPIPSSNKYDHLIYLVDLSIYMAIKVTENYFPDAVKIAELSGRVTAEKIITGENSVVSLLGGIIYPKNLFNVSTTKRRINAAFEVCNNCYLYPNIDLDEWERLNKEEEAKEGKWNKYGLFSEYISNTAYYKNILSDKERTYVTNKFLSDLKASEQ